MISKPQQWEQLASPGHVLLERVNVIHDEANLAYACLSIGVVLFFLSLYVGPRLFSGSSHAAAWITSIGSGYNDNAPMLRPLDPALPPLTPEQIGKLSSTRDALTWIADSKTRLGNGLQPLYCRGGSQITSSWYVGSGNEPLCRTSKDGARVWSWGALRQGADYTLSAIPFTVVYRKEPAGWAAYAVRDAGSVLPGLPAIDLRAVPRSTAADFPELIVK